jgi:hypothetical protein
MHAPGGIRTHNLSRRAAANPRHWDRLIQELVAINVQVTISGSIRESEQLDRSPCRTALANSTLVTVLLGLPRFSTHILLRFFYVWRVTDVEISIFA